ncbi:MAG: methionine--tRNA ligase [Candidatus Komeilibacteria bacterium]
MEKENKFYITTPIYYVNDEPHIGHAYTTVVGDVLARYHRQKGDDVFYLTGTDEHGAKIAESAKAKGIDTQEFCDQTAAKFVSAWESLNISNDYFIRTTNKDHKAAVSKIFQTFYDKGLLEEKEYEGLYCVGCEKFLSDKDLVDNKCPDHKREPEILKEKNWFFKLEQFLPKVQELIEKDEIEILPVTRKNEVLSLLKDGVMKDFSVSRQKTSVAWGVDLPFDNTQVSYVWVDALSNYITALGYPDNLDNFNKYWPADLHLLAQDILKFHAIYWPAFLLALGFNENELPKTLFIHGFFTINGEKMSKTIGNVIKPQELVDKYGVDASRYLLLSQFPFGQEADIREDHFVERYNADLANGYGNAVARVTTLIEKNELKFDIDFYNSRNVGEVGEYGKDSKKMSVHNDDWFRGIDEKYQEYRFDNVIKDISLRLRELDRQINDYKPWTMSKDVNFDALQNFLSYCAGEIYVISKALLPFMPTIAQQVLDILEADEIKKAPPLFPRLEN